MNEYALKQIDAIAEACKRIKPLVAIRCITFNHEPYIRDALEGFVMQKTDFPFVAIVHDDASTDGTAAIISEYAEKYPDIIFPIFETENQYSKHDGTLRRIMNAACDATGVKYIAFCEGDDYWIAPNKLFEQVHFIESNQEYGMCYTNVNRYNVQTGTYIDMWGGPNQSFEQLLNKNTIPTPAVLLKKDIYDEYGLEIKPEKKKWLMGDFPLWLYISTKQNIKYLEIPCTTVYRIIPQSASHQKDSLKRLEFGLNGYNIALFFARKYNKNTFQIKCRKYFDFAKYFIKRPIRITSIIQVYKRHKYTSQFK